MKMLKASKIAYVAACSIIIICTIILNVTEVFSAVNFTRRDIPALNDIRGQDVNGLALANFNNDPNNLIDIFIPLKWMFYQTTPGNFSLVKITNQDHIFDYSHCAVADYDNDGDIEIAVGSMTQDQYRGYNKLFDFNRTSNVYEDVSTLKKITNEGGNSHVAWLDYNNDGYLDLIFGEGDPLLTGIKDGMLYRNLGPDAQGNYKFTDVTNSTAEFKIYDNGTVKTLKDYMGNSTTWVAGSKIIIGDFNDDRKEDFIINREILSATYKESIFLKNLGNKTFQKIPIDIPYDYMTMGGIFFDADNDGDLDLIHGTTRQSGNPGKPFSTIHYFRNQGPPDYRFEEVINCPAFNSEVGGINTVTYGDYDNDGDFDVLISFDKRYRAASWVRLYQNDGAGNFSDISTEAGLYSQGYGVASGNYLGIAFVDIDNDGDLDIFNTAWNGQSSLWINSGNTNKWIDVDLVGKISNKHGFGSRVIVTVGNRIMTQEMPARGGYDTGNVLPLHFGLGSYTGTVTVEVKWPSGITQIIKDVQANQRVCIEELWQRHKLRDFLDTDGQLMEFIRTHPEAGSQIQPFINSITSLVVIGGGARQNSADTFFFDNIVGLKRGDLLFLSYSQYLLYTRATPHEGKIIHDVMMADLYSLNGKGLTAMSWDEYNKDGQRYENYLGILDGSASSDYFVYGLKNVAFPGQNIFPDYSNTIYQQIRYYDNQWHWNGQYLPYDLNNKLLDIAILANGDIMCIYAKKNTAGSYAGNYIYYISRARGGVGPYIGDLATLFKWQKGINTPDFRRPIKAIAHEVSIDNLGRKWPAWFIVQDDNFYIYLGEAPGAPIPQ